MDNRKIIVSFYIAASLVVWFLAHSTLHYLYISFWRISRIPGIQVINVAVPFLIGIVCFAVLFLNSQVNVVMEEAVAELKKVTWPSRTDVTRSTYVVMICILIASVFLATFDLFFGKFIGFLLS